MPPTRHNNWLKIWKRTIRLRAHAVVCFRYALCPHAHQRVCNLQHAFVRDSDRLVLLSYCSLAHSTERERERERDSISCYTTTAC